MFKAIKKEVIMTRNIIFAAIAAMGMVALAGCGGSSNPTTPGGGEGGDGPPPGERITDPNGPPDDDDNANSEMFKTLSDKVLAGFDDSSFDGLFTEIEKVKEDGDLTDNQETILKPLQIWLLVTTLPNRQLMQLMKKKRHLIKRKWH